MSNYNSYGSSDIRNNNGVINTVNPLTVAPSGDVNNTVNVIRNYQQGYNQFIKQNHFGYLCQPAPREQIVEKQLKSDEYRKFQYVPIEKTYRINPY